MREERPYAILIYVFGAYLISAVLLLSFVALMRGPLTADIKERLLHLEMRVQILEDEKSGGR